MKRILLLSSLLAVGFAIGSTQSLTQVNAKPEVIGVKLCALKKTGIVRFTTASCRKTERSVALEKEFLKWDFFEKLNKSLNTSLRTQKIAIDYLGIPSSSWSSPGCGSTATAYDASGSNLDASYGYWIFGAGITPPSSMNTLKIDPLVLTNGSNWKQVAKCRLEVTVVVPE